MKPIASRASLALVSLAKYLLGVGLGETLPPRAELAASAGAGVGTLERALDSLVSAGALEVDGVQGAGTTVTAIDYASLWRFAGGSILRGHLPLHMSVEMQAIESALGTAFAARDLEIALVYHEGASRRMAAVTRGLCDFAVVSRRAFEGAEGSLDVGFSFGPGSYYGPAKWYRLARRDTGQIRWVGADAESPDHVAMVSREFPGAEVVHAPFRLILPQIAHGLLDATVWCGGMALPAEYLTSLRARPVSVRGATDVTASQAVVVAVAGGAPHHLLLDLDGDLLAKTFTHVMETEQPGAPK